MSASWRTYVMKDIPNIRHNLPIILDKEFQDLRDEIHQLRQLLHDISGYRTLQGQDILCDAQYMDEVLDRMSKLLSGFQGVTKEGRENVLKNSEVCTWEALIMKDEDEEWTAEFEAYVEERLKMVMNEFEVFWELYKEAERELEELRRAAIAARWEEVERLRRL
ncbi:hypothetical protein K440DRAFT_637205 [Wilcoxina mikolae CBS 423.85]|nr:hypothetical protein K440DRAFT_637205 [Wilcoxina mikolae CBS 423.85]